MKNKLNLDWKTTNLYSSRTLDDFTKKFTKDNLQSLQKSDFKNCIETIGKDFDLDKLTETLHQTYKGKRVVEILLHKKMIGNLILETDEQVNTVRILDNEYSKVLASGFNLLFDVALSELYFLTNSFPKRISDEIKTINKNTIKKAIKYQPKVTFDEKTHNFIRNDTGKEVLRPVHKSFKEVYNNKNNEVKISPRMAATEGSIIAIYDAFAHKYKRFKEHAEILNAAVIAEDEGNKEEAETALMRLYGIKESASDVKPVRLGIRYRAVRDLVNAFSVVRPGYGLLKRVVDSSLETEIQDITKNVDITRREKAKFNYISIIGYGKRGEKLSSTIWGNGIITAVYVTPLLISKYFKIPEIPEVIRQIPLIGSGYDLFTNDIYGYSTLITILLGVNKIPLRMLRKEYENIQKKVYI